MIHCSYLRIYYHRTQRWRSINYKVTEQTPVRESQNHQIFWGTCKDQHLQLLAPYRTTQTQMLDLRALTKHSWSSSRARCAGQAVPCPLGQILSLPPRPPLAQLHAVPSGPIAVTQSRAQHCPPLPVRSCSRHDASPQLLCSGPSTPRVSAALHTPCTPDPSSLYGCYSPAPHPPDCTYSQGCPFPGAESSSHSCWTSCSWSQVCFICFTFETEFHKFNW